VAAAAIAAAGEGTPNVEGFNWIMDRSLMMANTMDCFQAREICVVWELRISFCDEIVSGNNFPPISSPFSTALPYSLSKLPVPAAQSCIGRLQGALGAMTQAEEAWLLPTPFYYFHLLNLCLAVCLGILSWAFLLLNGGAGSPISLVAYPFCALVCPHTPFLPNTPFQPPLLKLSCADTRGTTGDRIFHV
jgi:hypothetical protein